MRPSRWDHGSTPAAANAAPQDGRFPLSWPRVAFDDGIRPSSRRRALRDILFYGACGGLLIAILKLTEYRFLVVEHSVEIYGALVVALWVAVLWWLHWSPPRC